MHADSRRLARLGRLEKIRAIAKQVAANESAQAESTLAQLDALAARTGRLLDDYAARYDVLDAFALHQLSNFREMLLRVSQSTQADAVRARGVADEKLDRLAEAERRRQAVEDRAKAEARAISAREIQSPLLARKAIGTTLEE